MSWPSLTVSYVNVELVSTLTVRRSSPLSGRETPQLTTASRFFTTTLVKGRETAGAEQQGTLDST